MRAKRAIVGALDLGSSSVALVIAEVSREDVTVLGTGIAPCEGLSNGRVISINDTAAAITAARVEAEHMSGCELSEVYVSFSGRDITGMNNRGLIYHRKCAQVSRGDLESAIENAIHVRLDEGVVLNVVPRQYILDRHEGIKDPVGMSGVQLEAEVHMTIADRAALDTIERCVLKASLKVRDFVVAPLASSLAVLREDDAVAVEPFGKAPDAGLFQACTYVVFDLTHRRTTAVGRRDDNLDLIGALAHIAQDAQLAQGHHRDLGVGQHPPPDQTGPHGHRARAAAARHGAAAVSYTHLRAHETVLDIVCRLLLEKKNT